MLRKIDPERFILFANQYCFFIDRTTGKIDFVESYRVFIDNPEIKDGINSETRKMMLDYGFKKISVDAIGNKLLEFEGLSWEEFCEDMKGRGAKIIAERKKREERDREYSVIRDRFNGNIIGIDSKFLFATDKDTSIRLQLRVMPYAEQMAFVRKNKKNILDFVVEYISSKPRLMRQIGAWGFWRVSDIIVTRSSEVEIKFSVKKEIERALA